MTAYPIGRRALGALAIGASAAMLPGLTRPAAAATPDEIKKAGKISIGILTDYPPFGGIDENQKPAGYDADVSALLAKALGVQLQLVPVTGPNRIPFLLTNKVDMLVATFGITEERSKQVLFSNPYSAFTTYILAPKSTKISGPDDLKGVRVGVARASTQDSAVMAVAPKEIRIMRFDDDATTTQSIISGQVQAIGASSTVLAQLTTNYPKLEIEPKFTLRAQANGMAFRKQDAALRDWCNSFIAELVQNGELDRIHQRWFKTPMEPLPPMPAFAAG
ncbi:transporter substrate-binding domain-containing protein [Roseomonas marmotae]|uniref:Transporter substrate-binding domain-containing protein n=1 Tax=Roseomonas marmotae TaxID=2768161 RepID=A0ABS3KBP0_9PROT|nr:transporter substrate-binding domain-containing protein [Roseomonas marmotae]MBO1074890.1 transporter substrate-binding domain-containing protein [Roseomonas marmotae]QTI80608.1 transporter substrate-binding domain-containing protein [Roseomonas marmotae]